MNTSDYPLVECVINFSEGRNQDTIEDLAQTIRSSGAVYLLDIHQDVDHHRSVFTVVGEPSELERAIFEGIRVAAEKIDLNQHHGVHPRFGAADVVPFTPLRHATMDDCIAMAHRLGQRVGHELGIPVYLYDQAATIPERRNLSLIRNLNFQYEQLREAIAHDPAHMPDFGPAEVGTAGATIIGARDILVAFNVYLQTTDQRIAHAIAETIRESNGGLKCVKALGLLVNEQAQVSMNLIDYTETGLHEVVHAIEVEAQKHGTGIASSEIIGLVPRRAVLDTARHTWHLGYPVEQSPILEDRLELAQNMMPLLNEIAEPPPTEGATYRLDFVDMKSILQPRGFGQAVAQPTPTPAGAAVAALVGSLAGALTEMVAGITLKQARDAVTQKELAQLSQAAYALRDDLLNCILADVEAFEALLGAYRLPKTSAQRSNIIQEKLLVATQSPLNMCRLSLDVLHLIHKLVKLSIRNAVTDCAVAGLMAQATFDSAHITTEMNLRDIADKSTVDQIRAELQTLQEEVHYLTPQIIKITRERAGLAE